MDDLARRVDEEFAEQMCTQPGFVSDELMDRGDGEIMTVSRFGDAEQADAFARARATLDGAESWDFEFDTLDAMRGRVFVSRAARDMLEAGHPAVPAPVRRHAPLPVA